MTSSSDKKILKLIRVDLSEYSCLCYETSQNKLKDFCLT